MPRGWLPTCLAIALFACSGDGPCATPGAERREGICECPEGTHLVPVAGHSQCLADQSSSDPAGARDSGLASRDAAPDSAVADTSTPPDSATGSTDAELADAAVAHAAGADATVADADAQAADTGPTCAPTTEICDGADNDCDTQIDEGVQNACGTCITLEHPIGEACANGGQGACAKPGKYSCFNGTTVCDAPPATPSPEVCDGMDNDCSGGADNGLTNACGGSICDAKLADKGKACTAGTGDCQGTGVWECDGAASNTLRCTAREKAKNACGTSCGPVPAEDCSTPGDDNCNGTKNEGCCVSSQEICDGKDNNCNSQIDEGGVCPVCGDGVVTGSEECDPQASGSNQWSCSRTCTKQTMYRPCASIQDCSFAKGESCSEYAICTKTCDGFGLSGPSSGCPESPPGTTAVCIQKADGWGMCVASGCSNQKACDTGAACVGSGTQSYCFGCDRSSVCAAPQTCVYLSTGSFGTCQ